MPAIKKADIGKLSVKDFRADVKIAEEYINKKLKREFPNSDYVDIDVSSLKRVLHHEPGKELIKKLEANYRAKGWRVSYNKDDQDGDYLRFS